LHATEVFEHLPDRQLAAAVQISDDLSGQELCAAEQATQCHKVSLIKTKEVLLLKK